MVERVLIYRLGSLGDTIVALPSLRLVARSFPEAERRVLTNFPISRKAAAMETILGDSGLVHGYISYPLHSRSPRTLYSLRRAIQKWRPDVVVYLAAPRGRLRAHRDALFFRWCGVRRVIGVPYTRDLQEGRQLRGIAHYESEAERLGRCLAELGDAQCNRPESWDLSLTPNELREARELLWRDQGSTRIAVSAGSKAHSNDWGEANWKQLLGTLSASRPDLGLVLVGVTDEWELSERISNDWRGPKLNLCGRTSPRVSAAVMSHMAAFCGHDSGPMHLAAAVGTPCVAIFSARNKPGEWFPFGAQHRVIYHQTECFGCQLETCIQHQKRCIMSITVPEVLMALDEALKRTDAPASEPRKHRQ
jgi:heptosyltransferase III